MFNDNSVAPIYIFDLDGTLALNQHREHLIKGCDKPNWPEYFRQCEKDAPNWPVINTMSALYAQGAEIWIWSGRSEEVREQSIRWLTAHTPFVRAHVERVLKMRPAADYTPDDVMKAQWLQALKPAERNRLMAVFDDRQKVVNMWRQNSVACFQVAPGDF